MGLAVVEVQVKRAVVGEETAGLFQAGADERGVIIETVSVGRFGHLGEAVAASGKPGA